MLIYYVNLFVFSVLQYFCLIELKQITKLGSPFPPRPGIYLPNWAVFRESSVHGTLAEGESIQRICWIVSDECTSVCVYVCVEKFEKQQPW